MSGLSTHGVGAAACAKADVASADSAAAIKRVLVDIRVIIVLPGDRFKSFCRPAIFEQITNAILRSIRRVYSPQRASLDFRLCDFPLPASRLSFDFSLESLLKNTSQG